MGKLLDALQTRNSHTENGMVTNSSSLNFCVDLFFKIGAMRGQNNNRFITAFTKAFAEDKLTAMRLLFWARDIRGGAGEREIFRVIVNYLANKHTETLAKNLWLFSEYGRWDDLLSLIETPLEGEALNYVIGALKDNNGLCAKWCPRPNVNNPKKKKQAEILRKYLGLSPKEYRKMLVEKSNTVEQLMCSNKWNEIDYSKLPSKAISDLMNAFNKNDTERFQSYLNSLKKGETKINTGAIYPYDIIKNLKCGNENGADAQWASLPNYMEGNNERLLPMVDVSESMDTPTGKNGRVTCMDVAISLGLYISERNEGPFKDAFITFTSNPTLQYLKGTVSERYRQIYGDVGYNTNIEKAFTMLLHNAVKANILPEDMPTMIIMLSDMEFDCSSVAKWSAQDMIKAKYAEAGYVMPKLVYWNIQSRNDGNKPVQFDEEGTCLVSGFSPSLLQKLLSGNDITPYSMMMNVIDSDRYSNIRV